MIQLIDDPGTSPGDEHGHPRPENDNRDTEEDIARLREALKKPEEDKDKEDKKK